jgi:restriction system protein
MLPLLQFTADGREHSIREAREAIAQKLRLSAEDKAVLLPSGRQHTFDNRVAWAKIYLQRAGLLVSPRRGFFSISDEGRAVLKRPPERIDIRFLRQYPGFIEFTSGEKSTSSEPQERPTESETPEESLERASQRLREDLISEMLKRVKTASPQFFERLVVNLLVKMGYGGSLQQAGRAIGRSGDEGIDGVINEDRLGLDTIHIQAKKWDGSVGRPEIQKFVGALQGKQADKGVFITTGNFTSDAIDYVSRIPAKVVLIDGQQLSSLMIEHNLGVTIVNSYEVKRLDEDYFTEE